MGKDPQAASDSPAFAKNQAELARLLGVDRRSINTWRKEPGNPGARSNGSYCVADWRAWVEANGKRVVEGPTQNELKSKLIERQIVKLDIANRVALGQYRKVEDIEAWVGQMVTEAKRVLLSGPQSLAPQIVGVTIPEAEMILKQWLNEALTRLSADPLGIQKGSDEK